MSYYDEIDYVMDFDDRRLQIKGENQMAPPKKPRGEDLPQTTGLRAIVEQAVSKGATVEVIEKLLALQERYEANEARKAFNLAIADARPELPQIVKDRPANFGPGRASYKFEDLGDMVEALSPVLAKHGLSFRWRTRSDAHTVTVVCILSHEQGHSEETELTAGHDHSGNKNPVQAIGSTTAYLQRYTLKATLGIAAAHDDDGQSVGTNGVGEQTARPAIQEPTAKPTKKVLYDQVLEYCNGDVKGTGEILKKLTGKNSLNELSEAEAITAQRQFKIDYLDRQPGDE